MRGEVRSGEPESDGTGISASKAEKIILASGCLVGSPLAVMLALKLVGLGGVG